MTTHKTYFPLPTDANWKYSSGYGPRNIGGGASKFHRGVDMAVAKGTDVMAFDSGKVIFAGQQKGYGNVVYIRHGDGSTTRYAHLSQIDITDNQKISGGFKLGEVGNTGISVGKDGGYHLHFEYLPNGATKGIDAKSMLEEARLSNQTQKESQPTFTANLSPEIDAIMNGSYPSDGDPIMPATELTTPSASTKEQFSAQLQTPEAKQTTTFFKIAA
jgi:murein DD-endopeptidase MepM/ murein hydrolase activator NlpD